MVACSSRRFAIVADKIKYVEKLRHPVPVEVLPFAARLKELGGAPTLRREKMKDGPVITDNGNFVMDVDFEAIENPEALAARLCGNPGGIEHGIFDNMDELYLARASGLELIKRRR